VSISVFFILSIEGWTMLLTVADDSVTAVAVPRTAVAPVVGAVPVGGLLNVIVGALMYPEPPESILTAVILPAWEPLPGGPITAVPVARVPPAGGSLKVTVGAVVYPAPIPPEVIVTLVTGDPAVVALTVNVNGFAPEPIP
jgi:hypothetical protein